MGSTCGFSAPLGMPGCFSLLPSLLLAGPGLASEGAPLVPSGLQLPKTGRCDVYPWISLGLIPLTGGWWALAWCPAALTSPFLPSWAPSGRRRESSPSSAPRSPSPCGECVLGDHAVEWSQGHGVAGSGLPGPWSLPRRHVWGWAGPQIRGLKGQLTRWGRGCPSVRPIPQTPSAVGRGSRHPPRLPVPLPQEGLPRRGQGREAFPGWPWALTTASPPLQPHVLPALLLRAAPQAGRPGLGPRGSWGESVPPTPRQGSFQDCRARAFPHAC